MADDVSASEPLPMTPKLKAELKQELKHEVASGNQLTVMELATYLLSDDAKNDTTEAIYALAVHAAETQSQPFAKTAAWATSSLAQRASSDTAIEKQVVPILETLKAANILVSYDDAFADQLAERLGEVYRANKGNMPIKRVQQTASR